MFLLHSPWAPGLRFVGALANSGTSSPGASNSNNARISFAGGGASVEDAFVSCIGEAVERLSQFEQDGDATTQSIGDATHQLSAPFGELVAQQCQVNGVLQTEIAPWMSARDLLTGAPRIIPADWVLRRSPDGILRDRDSALSTGAAAGPNFEMAAVRALLELVERDAAALWWLGGRRARPLSVESSALAEAVRLSKVLRQDTTARTSWILDITSDLGIPTVAAISVDADGRGFVAGLAARLTQGDAVRSAMTELCQLEIGLMLARAKRAQAGDKALTEIDRRHLLRADKIDAETCELIHPIGVPCSDPDQSASVPVLDTTATEQLAHLTRILTAAGIEAALVDLTRPDFGIPVVKGIAPQLQALPSSLRTKRLCDAIAATGGAESWTGGMPLT